MTLKGYDIFPGIYKGMYVCKAMYKLRRDLRDSKFLSMTDLEALYK